VSMQDGCIVCAKRTIGSEIILDAHDVTAKGRRSCGISIRSIWRQCQCRCKIGARFAPNVRYAKELFWTDSMVQLGDGAQVEPLSVRWR
jgi:hypothetical protein